MVKGIPVIAKITKVAKSDCEKSGQGYNFQTH